MPRDTRAVRYCTKCGKESNNLRVCPHCFTPYPEGAPGARPSGPLPRRSTGSVRAVEEPTSGPSVPGAARRPTGATSVPPEGPAYGRRSTGAIRLTPADQVEGSRGALAPVLDVVRRQSTLVLISALGIAVLLIVLSGGSPEDEGAAAVAPVVPSTLTATPAERDEALRLLARTRDSALVETQADEVMVSYSAAVFPLDSVRQRQLVAAFARADEIVEGRKRRIYFYNPSGRVFAQSDGVTGLTIKP